MRALKPGNGAIPRAFPDGRRPEALKYREYCLNVQAHWGPLPKIALPMLREAGRAHVELERLAVELEQARAHRRQTQMRRLRRVQFATREQLVRLERRLEELAAGHRPGDLAQAFAQRTNA